MDGVCLSYIKLEFILSVFQPLCGSFNLKWKMSFATFYKSRNKKSVCSNQESEKEAKAGMK